MPSKSSPAFFGFTPATKQLLPFAYSRHMRVWNCPVLPVMPWVMTLVFLLTRMLIIFLLISLHIELVIPAEAGIQQRRHSRASGNPVAFCCPTSLGPRVRGDDERYAPLAAATTFSAASAML